MNITLSAEESVIQGAREWAAKHGTSLNAVIRDHLKSLAEEADRPALAEEFRKNALLGRSEADYRFSRDEVYSGKRFGS